MKSNVEKIEKNRVVMQVEVESGEFAKAVHRAYLKLVKKANIPGFRKGKAPRKILENYLGQGSLYSEAVDNIIPKAYYDAVQENALEPIDQPEVEVVQVEEGQPFIFKATVEVKPEVTLGEYKGLAVEKKEYVISDENVEKHLHNLQQRYAKIVNKEEGGVEQGDIVLIDFEGFIDGEAFPGGKGENYSLEIGSGTFIPGFEDQLVGLKPEDEKEVNVSFPEDYHQTDLAGKPAVFKVKIHGIKTKELSPIDDEFAKDVSEFETLEELKNDVRNRLKETAENKSLGEVKSQLLSKVVEEAQADVPKVMVERKVSAYLDEFKQRLMQQGLNLEQYLEYSGLTMEQIQENYRVQAEKSVKNDLVLEAIVKRENIEVTEEELDKEIEHMAGIYKQEPQAVKAFLASQGNLEALKYNMKLDKAVELLVREAKIEAVPAAEESK